MKTILAAGLLIAPMALGDEPPKAGARLVVLGIAQDGGVPQAGTTDVAAWEPAARRLVTSLALIDPAAGKRYLFEATPDFPEQLHLLDRLVPTSARPGLDGIFLTHAHIGHYLGLAHLGREVMGAKQVPVWAMPRMGEFLRGNGPWSQLVELGNIALPPLAADQPVDLGSGLSVTPILVPHRDEYSETVAFIIRGPRRSALFLPDIDKWEKLDQRGVRIEDLIAQVDVAYVDGTFFADGEIPGRAMQDIPHPFIRESLARFASLPVAERAKVRFIHLNRTNPALDPSDSAAQEIRAAGCGIAVEGEELGI
jgi:pyrroloquinoline quinone biosynthesis protein B